MSTPSTAITRLDLSISYNEFDMLANARNMICLKVLPALGVSQEAADFSRINLDNGPMRIEDTSRAPRSVYREDSWEWAKDSYSLQEHGVVEGVDDAELEKWGDVIRLEQRAVIRALKRMITRIEYDTAQAVFNTTTWTGASLTTTVATAWSVKATADPIGNIDAARDKVQSNCGQTPNALILNDKTFTNMIRTDRIESLLKGNSVTAPILMDAAMQPGLKTNSEFLGTLAGLLRVDKIIVGRSFYNSADRGQTTVMAPLWANSMAMLAYVGNDGINGDLESVEPQIGRILFSTKNGEPVPGADVSESLIFEEYRDEATRGSKYRARNKRLVKILQKEAGHLLQGL